MMRTTTADAHTMEEIAAVKRESRSSTITVNYVYAGIQSSVLYLKYRIQRVQEHAVKTKPNTKVTGIAMMTTIIVDVNMMVETAVENQEKLHNTSTVNYVNAKIQQLEQLLSTAKLVLDSAVTLSTRRWILR